MPRHRLTFAHTLARIHLRDKRFNNIFGFNGRWRKPDDYILALLSQKFKAQVIRVEQFKPNQGWKTIYPKGA